MSKETMLDHPQDPNKFDLRTHLWDGQGHLVKKNLYTKYVIKGEEFYERPVHSGNLWTGNNQPAGRIAKRDKPHPELGPFEVIDVPHKHYAAPLEGEEAVAYALAAEREKSAQLEAELNAIRAERAPKAVTPKGSGSLAAMAASPQLPNHGQGD